MSAAAVVTVRDATREDMSVVHQMILELAAYEGVPRGPQLTVDDLVHDGFECSPPWFSAYVAECGPQAVGYAIVNRAYSSWTRRAYYVEDLYVRQDKRRQGVGRALMRRVCALAAQHGAHRIDWHVLQDNEPALTFYRRLGARDLRITEGRAALRLDQEHIQRLAAETCTSTGTGEHLQASNSLVTAGVISSSLPRHT